MHLCQPLRNRCRLLHSNRPKTECPLDSNQQQHPQSNLARLHQLATRLILLHQLAVNRLLQNLLHRFNNQLFQRRQSFHLPLLLSQPSKTST